MNKVVNVEKPIYFKRASFNMKVSTCATKYLVIEGKRFYCEKTSLGWLVTEPITGFAPVVVDKIPKNISDKDLLTLVEKVIYDAPYSMERAIAKTLNTEKAIEISAADYFNTTEIVL